MWHRAQIEQLFAIAPAVAKRPWEAGQRSSSTARPFGAGSWVEPISQTVLVWYRCGWRGAGGGKTCVARSHDGLEFHFPKISNLRNADGSTMRDTNVVLSSRSLEAFEVAYDHLSTPPKFRALRMEWMTGGRRVAPYTPYESTDGLRWSKAREPGVAALVMADRSTFFLNPLRKPAQWVYSLRENLCEGGPSGHMRARRYWERSHSQGDDKGSSTAAESSRARRGYAPFIRDYFQCADVRKGEPVAWFAVDQHDCCAACKCDVYNVDGIAYESVLMHGLAILNGPNGGGELKNNTIHLGFSRDGFHMARPPPPRRPFIELPPTITRGTNPTPLGLSNAQLASGSPIVSADGARLLFYFGFGASSRHTPDSVQALHSHYLEATGVATLRRDGFVSLAVKKNAESGKLVTRPLLIGSANKLFVNVVLPSAANTMRVEVLSGAGQRANASISPPPWAKLCGLGGRHAPKLTGPLDAVRTEVVFSGERGLDALSGRRVRLRFTLSGAGSALYAFWLASSPSGLSGGYLGGGQIGRKGSSPVDT